MTRKVWIINLCLVAILCALLFGIHMRNKAEIARSNETMMPEVEIPIEDDAIVQEDSGTNNSSYTDEQPADEKMDEDSDSEHKADTVPSDDEGSEDNSDTEKDSTVELPIIP